MVDGHDGVIGVGAEVADEDEAFELRKDTLEIDAVHVAAAHSFAPEVGDVATEDTVGLEAAAGGEHIQFDHVQRILVDRLSLQCV